MVSKAQTRKRKTKRQRGAPVRPAAKPATIGRWSVAFLVLTVGVVWSGLAVVGSAQQTRALYHALDQTQRASDELLEEQSRLNLEIGAISSLQEVEQIALSELDMSFPDVVKRVAP